MLQIHGFEDEKSPKVETLGQLRQTDYSVTYPAGGENDWNGSGITV